MFWFCESVFDAILTPDAIEDIPEGVLITGAIGGLDTVAGQDSMDSVRDGLKQVT